MQWIVPLSVQFLSLVWLFVTPWTAACQASLSITNSWSLLKLMPIESVMPYDHLILCHPLLLLPSIFPRIRVFSKESVLRVRWPKYWSFTFSISPSNGDTVLCLWWSLGIFLLLFQILGWKHSSHISRPNSQERNWLKKANYHDTCMDICVTSHGPLIHLWVSCGHMVISGGTSMNTFRRASQKGGERRDGWMALLIQWT